MIRLAGALLAAGLLAAADPAVACPGRPAIEAVGLLAQAGVGDLDLDPAWLAAGGADAPACFALPPGSGPAAARQALAHALAAWLVPDPAGGWLASRDDLLPATRLQSRTIPSALIQRSDLEAPAAAFLAPWLRGHAGVGYHPVDGSWAATLDDAGWQRLTALVVAWEHHRPLMPPAPAAPPAPAGTLAQAIPAGPWPAWCTALAAAGVAVAVAPDAVGPAPALDPGPLAGLPGCLAAASHPAAWVDGVLCLGGRPMPRLHPGLAARVGVIPAAHLDPDLPALAARLRTAVRPWAWTLPGWGLMADGPALVAVADPATLHALLAHLAAADRALPGAGAPAILPP